MHRIAGEVGAVAPVKRRTGPIGAKVGLFAAPVERLIRNGLIGFSALTLLSACGLTDELEDAPDPGALDEVEFRRADGEVLWSHAFGSKDDEVTVEDPMPIDFIIAVTFDLEVDYESARRNTTLEVVNGAIVSTEATKEAETISLRFVDPLDAGTQYELYIDEGIETVDGETIDQFARIEFETE